MGEEKRAEIVRRDAGEIARETGREVLDTIRENARLRRELGRKR